MIQGSVGSYAKLFPTGLIPAILLLILHAGKNTHKQTPTDREDWITLRLHHQLIREPLFRDGPLQIDLQTDIVHSASDSGKNTPEGRLDLKVSCGHGYEIYFAIEAKRLRVSLPSGLFLGGREYVKDGMMRFVTGQYAPLMQAGAMLGYVYDGETELAFSDIDRHIQKQAEELKLKDPKKLTSSPTFPSHPINETNHALGNRLFTVFHLFLPV